jgi:1-acyl-sn-glycerol-3-phosphate acyltransferase
MTRARRAANHEKKLALLARIKDCEQDGTFNRDVEDDPPARALKPKDVDFLNSKLKSKLCTLAASLIASAAQPFILRHHRVQFEGLESARSIRGGAIVTCNHRGKLDSVFVRAALRKARVCRRLYKIVAEVNFSIPGMAGFLLRHWDTLPLSSSFDTMKNLMRAVEELLRDGNVVLVFPEKAMWWNYRKSRPFMRGAFHFAATNNVPVLPCFITAEDTARMDANDFPLQKVTVHVMSPIIPDPAKSDRENEQWMLAVNEQLCREKQMDVYGGPEGCAFHPGTASLRGGNTVRLVTPSRDCRRPPNSTFRTEVR